MNKNGLDIQTISTKRTEIQNDRVLLFVKVTEKREKADPSHLLKFLFGSRKKSTFAFALTHKADPSQNQKSRLFAHAREDSVLNKQLTSKVEVQ
jgi:hypothetical protein